MDNNSVKIIHGVNEALALRTIKAFLSSTFQDMEDERNYLAKYTFPRIIDFCQRRHISFAPIDLRWGITEEEDVLQVCFDEIERSVPFFIGLVGARYGWTPLKEDFDKGINDRYKRLPWIEQAIQEKKSITEIEFLFGALKREGICNASFYIKANVIREKRQEELKRFLEEQSRFSVKEYSSVEDLGELIYNDLISHITRIFPENESLLSFRKRSHGFMLALRAQNSADYETETLKKLYEWHKGKGRFCAIYSERILREGKNYESCPGKSTQLCRFLNEIRNNGCHIIYYDTQAINDEAVELLDDLSEYIIQSIREIADDTEIVLAIDNLNIYRPEDTDRLIDLLEWLPHRVRTLMASRYCGWMRMLDFEYIICHEPDSVQKGLILDKFLSIHGKKMASDDKALIISSEMTVNEIMHMLESMLRFGSHEKISQEISRYLKGGYQKVLIDEIKKDVGNMKKGAWEAMWILNAIALSNEGGLSEAEIIGLCEITPLRWASIRKRVMELCIREGAFYKIDEQGDTVQTLIIMYYSNFRDMIIDRMKMYIAEKGMSSARLGSIIPNLYLSYFGARDEKDIVQKWRDDRPTVFQDVELVNNMPLAMLRDGWRWKDLYGMKISECPKRWLLRTDDPTYSEYDMIKYYTRLKMVTETLGFAEENLACIDRLHELSKNDHQHLIHMISYLCRNHETGQAYELFRSENLTGSYLTEAVVAIGRGAFDNSRIDIATEAIDILKNAEIHEEADENIYLEAKLLEYEYRIAEIYGSYEGEDLTKALREEGIHTAVQDILAKVDRTRHVDDLTMAKAYQLAGYTQMMAGNHSWGVRHGLNTYIGKTSAALTRGSLQFQHALIDYGLGLLKVGETELANDHFRSSKIFSYSPEKLTNPWIINSLELLTSMEGVDYGFKRDAEDLLKRIFQLEQFN